MHHVNTLLLSTSESARKPHLSHVCQFAEMLPSVQTQAHCRCLCYGLPYAVQFASAGRMCQIFVNAAQCRRPGVHLTPPLQCMKANCMFAQPQSVCETFAQSKLEQRYSSALQYMLHCACKPDDKENLNLTANFTPPEQTW